MGAADNDEDISDEAAVWAGATAPSARVMVADGTAGVAEWSSSSSEEVTMWRNRRSTGASTGEGERVGWMEVLEAEASDKTCGGARAVEGESC